MTTGDSVNQQASGLFVPHQIPRVSLLDDARLLLAAIEAFPELDRRRCSRLAKIAQAVALDTDAVIPAGRADFPVVQQATKDLTEFAFIWRVLCPIPSDSELWHRFGKLFSDSVLPSQSNERSDARNAQFELLCEAMLCRAGLTPRYCPAGSDFACVLGDKAFVVEAKLARSLRAVKAQFQKGAEQIRRSALPGLIMVDHTFAVNERRSNQVLAAASAIRDPMAAQSARFAVLHERHLRRLEPELIRKGVIGYALVDRVVLQDGIDQTRQVGRWKLAVFRDHVVLPSNREGDCSLARTVFNLLEAVGLPAH